MYKPDYLSVGENEVVRLSSRALVAVHGLGAGRRHLREGEVLALLDGVGPRKLLPAADHRARHLLVGREGKLGEIEEDPRVAFASARGLHALALPAGEEAELVALDSLE